MSIGIEEFEAFFGAIYRDLKGNAIEPFPWQSRLARYVFHNGWPKCIDLPTASGKTTTIDIAIFVLAAQADRATHQRTVGRRVFFGVNRRVIVDEAHERAVHLAKSLLDAEEGIVRRVADALRSTNGDASAPPLDVAELRGGIYRDRRWARGITQPIVVATTADQVGSRLLFRGYGVSPGMQPIHAALTACDSTILLDEAHVTRPFSQTLEAIACYRKQDATSPPMQFVQMTATPADVQEADCFRLASADRAHPILAKRQNASKSAELVFLGKVKDEKLIEALVQRAVNALGDASKAVGVLVNRVRTARDVCRSLRKKLAGRGIEADVHLVIGRMRPLDRDGLTQKLRDIVGPERRVDISKPCFVVATQCLEVGADYDFDAIITECASIDALRQRFGRLNRKGRPINPIAAILTTNDALKGDDPVYGDALKHTWEWLTKDNRKSIDFGITAFQPLWDALSAQDRARLVAPSFDAAILLPAHLDALCQTAPPPTPSPDVSYFIHGPQREDADVQVCWRADLGENSGDWPEIVSMLPPASPECMTVPIRTVRKWMGTTTQVDADADIAARPADEREPEVFRKKVLVWRGTKDTRITDHPNGRYPSGIHPGDTIVIPAAAGGWNTMGHVPEAPNDEPPERREDFSHWARSVTVLDVAEQAVATSRRQCTIRIHPNLRSAPLLAEAFSNGDGLGISGIRELVAHYIESPFFIQADPLTTDNVRELLTRKARIRVMRYPSEDDERGGLVLRFSELLKQDDPLRQPVLEEDDDDDSSSEIGVAVSLADHTAHVVEKLMLALPKLHMTPHEACLRRAAELHDYGKADVRFQAMLLGSTPEEASLRPMLLGKSRLRDLSIAERRHQKQQARVPDNFRHEMLSAQIVEYYRERLLHPKIGADPLLHLIAAHHGHARPFAPIVIDDGSDDDLELSVDGLSLSAGARRQLVPSHRLDSGVAERFWKLTRAHGWWGLAYLESILRLADQQASEAEQNQSEGK